MDFDEIKQILEMVREHELSEFELEREGFKIRIRKGGQELVAAPPPVPIAPAPAAPAPPASSAVLPDDSGTDEEIELAVVKSPIVGTFYRAPEPGARNFAEIGDTVRKGQVLCIIEAMKLMNEITCDYDGELVKVYVENGQPVQYGERLFAVRAR